MNEIDDFILKHAGVRGMKWGVRKPHQGEGVGVHRKLVKAQVQNNNKRHLSDRQKRVLFVGSALAAGAAITVGSMYAQRVLHKNGLLKAANLKHKGQLAELDQITNFMGSRMHGPLS